MSVGSFLTLSRVPYVGTLFKHTYNGSVEFSALYPRYVISNTVAHRMGPYTEILYEL